MRLLQKLASAGLAAFALAPAFIEAETLPPKLPAWAASLRATVQLDPARGVRLAAAEEERALGEPDTPDRKVAILTARYYRSEALLQLNRAREAMPIVEAAIREPLTTTAGRQLHGQFLLVRAGIRNDDRKPAEALADFQTAYRIFVEIGQPRNQAVALMGIGSIYQDAGDYRRVLYYYSLADDAFSSDSLLGLSSANNQGNALAELGDFRGAERKYRRALSYSQKLHSPVLEARILKNLALMQLRSGDLNASAQSLALGLDLSRREPGAKAWQPLLLGTAAQLELARHAPRAAVRLIEQAFAGMTAEALADQSNRDLHEVAYRAYKSMGDEDNALRHLEAFRTAENAGRALATETNNALLAARFDFANQNSRISSLRAGQLRRDIALTKLQSRQNAILLGSLLALVTIVAIGLAVYLRALRRSRDSIQQANAKLSDANEELAHALSAKSRFLATTSHEIRTPLNGVLGMTQVILADPSIEPDLRDRIQLVHGAGETMRQLVDDILEFARIDAGKIDVEKTVIDLHRLLDDSVNFWRTQATATGLTLEVEFGETPHFVVEDGRRVRQIIFNLLSNAIKFTPMGAINVVATATHDVLTVEVRDTGIGIAADAFPLIFEMFSQADNSTSRQFSGSGLGLSISRSLAQALGGNLTVASTPGVGSVFALTLPLLAVASPALVEPPLRRVRAVELSTARLLLIGGSPIAQSVIRSLVRDKVAHVGVAVSPDDVWTNSVLRETDVVIIDCSTLDDVASRNVIDELQPYRDRLSIVVLLRDDDAPVPEGADRVVARPLTGAALLDTLAGLVEAVANGSAPVVSVAV